MFKVFDLRKTLVKLAQTHSIFDLRKCFGVAGSNTFRSKGASYKRELVFRTEKRLLLMKIVMQNLLID